jgi:KipI family sensor histidine kinase inhibitor
VAEQPVEGEIEALGEAALLLRLGDRAESALAARVQALAAALRAQPLQGLIDLVPAYASLALHFDPLRVDASKVADWLRAAQRRLKDDTQPADTPRRVEIPVCYGGDYGPDLSEVANQLGLTEAEIIARHSGGDYIVAMLGFLPGFPYLLGLDPSLAVPRLATPRAEVKAGSVGIGGAQTGIYPQSSPGGWRLIGRTPESLFDARRTPPSLLQPGDRVRFVAIDPGEFKMLQREPQR